MNPSALPQSQNIEVEASLSKTVTKVVIVLLVAGGVYFIYRRFRSGILQIFGKISEGDVVREAKKTTDTGNLSYENLWYESAADSLFNSMAGTGTTDQRIFAIFSQINTLDDLKRLITTFGTRSGKPSAFSRQLTGNLATWLSAEMTAGEIAKINSILTKKNIQFSF